MSRTLPLAFLIFPVLISVVLHLLLLLLLLRSCYAAIVKIHYKLCSFGGPARSRHRPENRTPAIWMRLLAICSMLLLCYSDYICVYSKDCDPCAKWCARELGRRFCISVPVDEGHCGSRRTATWRCVIFSCIVSCALLRLWGNVPHGRRFWILALRAPCICVRRCQYGVWLWESECRWCRSKLANAALVADFAHAFMEALNEWWLVCLSSECMHPACARQCTTRTTTWAARNASARR